MACWLSCLFNHSAESQRACDVAGRYCGGAQNIVKNPPASMGAEDFAYMFEERKGSYIWIGGGEAQAGKMLHNTSMILMMISCQLAPAIGRVLLKRNCPSMANYKGRTSSMTSQSKYLIILTLAFLLVLTIVALASYSVWARNGRHLALVFMAGQRSLLALLALSCLGQG